jgi:hypothetical protein
VNYCEGCLSYTGCYLIAYSCLFDFYNDEGQCPCTLCIIKVMCEDVCDDFTHFKNAAVERGANNNV